MSLGWVGTSELLQQPGEVGVGALVVDDEPRVDGVALSIELDVDRVGVASDAIVGLEDPDVVAPVQAVGCDQPRDAASDDRDPHQALPRGAIRTWVTHHSLPPRAPKSSAQARKKSRQRWNQSFASDSP